MQITLVNMSTFVADGVGNVEREIVATFLCCHLQQVQILLLREMLLQVHVQGRTTRQVLDIGSAMQLKLVDNTQ